MDAVMDQDKLKALAAELAKDIKSEKDLGALTQQLVKLTVETALNAELNEHLGYEKHSPTGRGTGNSRNGTSKKRVKSQHGEVDILTPRDRNGSFEPQFVRKGQTRLTQMDDQILYLYGKGMTTREIVDAFKEMYDADVSPGLISKVTDAVIEEVVQWQNRPLDPVYPIVYLDCIVVKVRHNKQVINKAIHLALGITLDGHKELLGMWIAENEGAKFWLSVLTELQNRGLERYPHRLCRRPQWIPRRHPDGLPQGADPAVHRPHGAQLAEVRLLEGLQGRHCRPQGHLPVGHGTGRPGRTGGLCQDLG